jgi:hypothetical protein
MENRMRSAVIRAAALTTCLMTLSAVNGQTAVEAAAEPIPQEAPPDFKFTVGGGAIHQFETSVDDGGDVSINRLGGVLDTQTNLGKDLEMSIRLTYAVDAYDFSDAIGIGAGFNEPWDDIHTAAAGVLFTYAMSQQWRVFGGPVFQSARESGADFSDGITAGGIFGATYIASRELVVGGGLIITSQLEDDIRVSPLFILSWGLSDNLRVSSRTTGNILTRTGAELVYAANKKWEFGFGLANYFSRFRLDDEGPAPDGVGEDESLPIWLRATYSPSSAFHLEALGGLALNGNLRLENEDGDRITDQDYDPSPFLGLFVNVNF